MSRDNAPGTPNETTAGDMVEAQTTAPASMQGGHPRQASRKSELTLDVLPVRSTTAYKALRRTIAVGFTLVVAMSAGIVYTMAKTVISGAVIANGTLTAEGGPPARAAPVRRRGRADHGRRRPARGGRAAAPEAGHDGGRGAAVERDEQPPAASRCASTASLAERGDGEDEVIYRNVSQDFFAARPHLDWILETEKRQFDLRRDEREGQRAQLRERAEQMREQVAGDTAQLEAAENQIQTISKELDGLRDLFRRKLVPYQRVSELERDLSELQGRRGALKSSIAGRATAAWPRSSCRSSRSTRTCAPS